MDINTLSSLSRRSLPLLSAACVAALFLTAFLLCTGGQGLVIRHVISMKNPRYPAIYFGLFALVISILLKRWHRAPALWPAAMYAGWALLGDLLRGKAVGQCLEYTLTNVCVLVLFYFGMVNRVEKRGLIRNLVLVYVAAGCAIAIFSTYEHWTQGIDTLCPHLVFWPTKGRLGSFSLALAVTGLGLASGYRRRLSLLILCGTVGLIGTASLLFTYDRTSYVGLAVALAVLAICSVRKGWMLVGAMALLVGITALIGMRGYRSNTPFHTSIAGRVRSFFDTQDKNTRSRLLVFKGAMRVALDHPLVGVSEEGFKEAYDRVRDPGERDSRRRKEFHAHNILLQSAATRGIPAALIMGGFILWILRWLWGEVWRQQDPLARGLCLVAISSLLGFLASGMGDVPKFENYLTVAFQLGLAVCACRWMAESMSRDPKAGISNLKFETNRPSSLQVTKNP